MKINWLPLAAAVAFAAGSVSASAVDFNGYFRAGAQFNAVGGEVYCVGNGNDGHKVGRLGDECDTYAEVALSQNVYDKAGSKFSVHTLVAYGTTEGYRDLQGNSWQGVGSNYELKKDNDGNYTIQTVRGPWDSQRLSFREAYAKYDTDAGYSIWSGKRFYRRKDIHILDLYYLNDSGYGAGIEGIDVGNGNLNFAVVKWANDGTADYNRNVYKLDARWDGINLGAFGALDTSVIYALPAISKKQKDDGAGARANTANSGALITLDLGSNFGSTVNVSNHFIAQWGSNGFAYVGAFKNHAGDNYTPDVDADGVRLIDWGTLDWGSDFDLGYSFLWGHLNSGKNHGVKGSAWTYTRSGWEYSIVLRPEYKWTEYTRTTLELGYSEMKRTGWVADEKYGNPDLYKVTLAQQFTPGKGFWSRPAIRFYASYINGDQFSDGWNVQYRNKNHGSHSYQFTFGTQVEAWW
ncbi:MAG: carbohydrate porin [Ruminobacter sp.]|nr:carbohydrate porin [Ruminobacter sp.]